MWPVHDQVIALSIFSVHNDYMLSTLLDRNRTSLPNNGSLLNDDLNDKLVLGSVSLFATIDLLAHG